MRRDKQNIKTTDWLIRGIPEEQLKREKQEAIMSAYLQLCITYDEETNSIDFDATAEKMVAEGYVKASDLAEEIFAEIEETFKECLWFLENHPSDYPRMDRTKINVYKDNLQYIAEIKNKYKGE